jgi:hypothetical protein
MTYEQASAYAIAAVENNLDERMPPHEMHAAICAVAPHIDSDFRETHLRALLAIRRGDNLI